MPYIKRAARVELDNGRPALTAGELNYNLTLECLAFLSPEPDYRELNEVVGALECTKQEFLRRMVASYEDKKIAENGDVYPEAIP